MAGGRCCSIADIGCWGRMVFAAEGGLSLDARPNSPRGATG
jgi:glutathione S-transferase